MSTKYQVTPEVLSSKIDEEIVLMSIEAGYYFGLEPVGSRIWEILSEKPATFDELVTQLMEEYDVDVETCQNDVKSFIDDMVSKKLLIQTD